MLDKKRCKWSQESELLIHYHDEEWGREVTEDNRLFECLTLEMFQAGLSWRTILHKRENFRKAFDGFEIETVMNYGEKDVERLLGNEGIVRHRRKIEAAIENARRCHDLIKAHGSLIAFFQSLPPDSMEKQKVLKATFKHFGLTTAESFLMATGMMPTQHEDDCHLHQSLLTARD